MVTLVYAIGFVIAFILVMMVRCPKFEVVKLSDIMASLICGVLSWFTVAFFIFAFICYGIWEWYDSKKDVVIFRKKSC